MLTTSLTAKQVLVLGDSLSAGYGLDMVQPWPCNLEECRWEVVNLSVTNSTIQEGHQRLALYYDHADQSPDYVLIALGSNDGLRSYPIEQIETSLHQLIQCVRDHSSIPLVIGWDLPPNYGPYAEAFRDVFHKVSLQEGVNLIECPLREFAMDFRLFQEDGYHPNDDAQPILARRLCQELAPYAE